MYLWQITIKYFNYMKGEILKSFTILIGLFLCLFLFEGTAVAVIEITEPYIQFVPNPVAVGEEVYIYGRNFCGDPACSDITITVNGMVMESDITISENGYFETSFNANLPPAFGYLVVVTQTAADNSILKDSGWLVVTVMDEIEEQKPKELSYVSSSLVSDISLSSEPTEPAFFANTLVVVGAQPNVKWGGRTVAIDVNPSNRLEAIAASESGGLFKTNDNGVTWRHLDNLPPFMMADVKYSPDNPRIVVATSMADSSRQRADNQGGIWRSTDSGEHWQQPANSKPTCINHPNAYGIAFAKGTSYVFVGTDCGVAISNNYGGSWNHTITDPHATRHGEASVIASRRIIPGSTSAISAIVDVCGQDGHHRSTNAGATWTPVNPGSPKCAEPPYHDLMFTHAISRSPYESNVLFVASEGPVTTCGCSTCFAVSRVVYESDNGGLSWDQVIPEAGMCPMRQTWVAANYSPNSPLPSFDIYFGTGDKTWWKTCSSKLFGRRCTRDDWQEISTDQHNIDHGDANGIGFDPVDNCPKYMLTDGGVHISRKCGVNWSITGGGNKGFNALQVYEITGQVHPNHTDLYFGTQDNDIWASGDNGVTWPGHGCCEGFFLQMKHNTPSDVGQKITGVACGACFDFLWDAHFAAPLASIWPAPPTSMLPATTPPDPPNQPTVKAYDPFMIDTDVYFQYGLPYDHSPNWEIYLRTGTTWTKVPGGPITVAYAGRPYVSGPASAPIIYQGYKKTNGKFGLMKIEGVRSVPGYSWTAIDSGVDNIAFTCLGSYVWTPIWGVDPSDPNHIIVTDAGDNTIKYRKNGDSQWHIDNSLTSLVTKNNLYKFADTSWAIYFSPFSQVRTIGFDQSNPNRILVGTMETGIIASLDDGNHWARLQGSEKVVAATSFFFDEQRNEVIASSYGRGLFKVDARGADLQVSKKSSPTVIAGDSFDYTIYMTNNGPLDALNAVLYDNLPEQVFFQSMIVPSGWNCRHNSLTRTITCNKPLVAANESATFTFMVRLNPDISDGTEIINRTGISTDTLESRYDNNISSASSTARTQADLSINKVAQLNAGGIIQYTITVRNSGPSYAHNIQVKDFLAASTTYINHITTQGSCAFDGAIVGCPLGDMAPRAAARIVIRVKRTSPVIMVSNTADVTLSTPDPNPANNTFTIRVPVYGLFGISLPEDSIGLTLLQTDNVFALQR
jgi:uncharacterized repeat protein (TIGR01451 family)